MKIEKKLCVRERERERERERRSICNEFSFPSKKNAISKLTDLWGRRI